MFQFSFQNILEPFLISEISPFTSQRQHYLTLGGILWVRRDSIVRQHRLEQVPEWFSLAGCERNVDVASRWQDRWYYKEGWGDQGFGRLEVRQSWGLRQVRDVLAAEARHLQDNLGQPDPNYRKVKIDLICKICSSKSSNPFTSALHPYVASSTSLIFLLGLLLWWSWLQPPIRSEVWIIRPKISLF